MVGSTIGFDTSGLKIYNSSKHEFMLYRRGLNRSVRDTLHKHSNPIGKHTKIKGGVKKNDNKKK